MSLKLIAWAQRVLDTVPDESAYWDTAAGEFILDLANEFGLTPTTTNEERLALAATARETIGATNNG